MLGDINDPALVHQMRMTMGLDRPVWEQYLLWGGRALHGDLGRSIVQNEPVSSLIASHFPVTAQIVLTSTLIACLVAIPAGMFAAWRQNRAGDIAVVTTATLLVSAPSFWVGILLLWLFGVKLEWLPTYGFASLREGGLGALRYLVLPVLAILLTEMASITRMMRASAIDVLRLEFVAHARAKGLRERRVLMRHALPNAFGPTLTVVGLIFGHLLSGAAVIETVFTLPGLGRLMLYIAINLLIDLLYPLFDPRITL
jgi:peptide/nickel transport system permease protein